MGVSGIITDVIFPQSLKHEALGGRKNSKTMQNVIQQFYSSYKNLDGVSCLFGSADSENQR